MYSMFTLYMIYFMGNLPHFNKKRFDQIGMSLSDKLIWNESSKNKEERGTGN